MADQDKAAFGFNPNLRKQGALARAKAAARDVNTLPDPKTYAAVAGALGTPFEDQGWSVFHPKREGIRQAADVGYATGIGAQLAPVGGPLARASKALAPKAGELAMEAASRTGAPVYGLGVVERGGNPSKVSKFIEDVNSQYPTNPMNPRQRAMVFDNGESLGTFELKPSGTMKDAVELDWISGYPQRKGVGSRTLNAIKEHAQEAGIPITLWPWDKGQVSQKALTNFYKKHGFEPSTKGGKGLVWRPEEKASTEPFWYNPQNETFAAFPESGMHNKVIQDPEYAGKLGTTADEAFSPESKLLMGRQRGKALDLMQMSAPSDESLSTVRGMMERNKLTPETVNLSAGENLFEGIPAEELKKMMELKELEKYQKYAQGGTVKYPSEEIKEKLRQLRESFVPAAKEYERQKRIQENLEKMNPQQHSSAEPEEGTVELYNGGVVKKKPSPHRLQMLRLAALRALRS
jgi:hypothetical protein